MTTAADIVTPALENIGAHSIILQADPSLFERGRTMLVSLLEELAVDNIELGTTATPVVLPTTLATNINERLGARQALIDIMSERLVTPARLKLTADILNASAVGLNDLKDRFLVIAPCYSVPSTLMTRGQGNTRGVRPNTFFSGDALDADTST